MNKFIIYLLLLCSPVIEVSAQTVQDSTTTAFTADDRAAAGIDEPIYKDRKFDQKFKDKYTDPDFQYEPKTTAKSWWDRFWESLRNLLDRIFGAGGKAGGSTAMDIFVKVLAVIIVAGAIYLIVRAVLNKQGGWIFGRSNKNIGVSEITEEDLKQMDFPKLVAEAAGNGSYNLAIRYYFLWLLRKLSEREIIDWHWEKTNSDYMYEIKSSALRKDFEYLSYLYDYSWYGNFTIDKAAYEKAEAAFRKTLNTL